MGFMQLGENTYRAKCDECGKSSGDKDELELGNDGWVWFELTVTKKTGDSDRINRAYCPDCDGEDGVDVLEEMLGRDD